LYREYDNHLNLVLLVLSGVQKEAYNTKQIKKKKKERKETK